MSTAPLTSTERSRRRRAHLADNHALCDPKICNGTPGSSRPAPSATSTPSPRMAALSSTERSRRRRAHLTGDHTLCDSKTCGRGLAPRSRPRIAHTTEQNSRSRRSSPASKFLQLIAPVDLGGHAACAGQAPSFDAEVTGESQDEREARLHRVRTICGGCPVQTACSALGLAFAGEVAGVWAGELTEAAS